MKPNVHDESTADEGGDILKPDEAGDKILWVRELGLREQDEDYDSEEDSEWVPPSIIFDEDLDYDEVGESGAEIDEDELTGLKEDQKLPLQPGEALPAMVCGCQPPKNDQSEQLEVEEKELPTKVATDGIEKLGETIKKLETHDDHRHCPIKKTMIDETPVNDEKNTEMISKINVTPKKTKSKTTEKETGKSPKSVEGKEVTAPEGNEKVEEKVQCEKEPKNESEKSEDSGAKDANVKKVSPNKKKGSGEKKRKGSKGKMAF